MTSGALSPFFYYIFYIFSMLLYFQFAASARCVSLLRPRFYHFAQTPYMALDAWLHATRMILYMHMCMYVYMY